MLRARIQGNDAAAKAQAKIDEVSDETDAIAAQLRTTQKQITAIRQFNGRMRELVATQESELASVAGQLDRVEEVDRSVTPLMLRMIEALERFVELDVPFLPDERAERIAALRTLLDRADITNASKFRQIMEAYQIENEYGRTIEAYRGNVEIDGEEATVDLLRFGRIVLAFQSLDRTVTGAWNPETRQWDILDARFAPGIREGIRVARKLAPPDLIRVPLLPPRDQESK